MAQRTWCSPSEVSALLAGHSAAADTVVWAYCRMPNHVHLLAVPSVEDGLRQAFADANQRYARRVNACEGCHGHLWQERFGSCPVDGAHLWAAARYIELNPVRAHLAGTDDALVRVAPLLEAFGDWAAYLAEPEATAQVQTLRQRERTGRLAVTSSSASWRPAAAAASRPRSQDRGAGRGRRGYVYCLEHRRAATPAIRMQRRFSCVMGERGFILNCPRSPTRSPSTCAGGDGSLERRPGRSEAGLSQCRSHTVPDLLLSPVPRTLEATMMICLDNAVHDLQPLESRVDCR